MRRSEWIRTSYNKVVTVKHLSRYQVWNIPKLNMLETMTGKKESVSAMGYRRYSGKTQNNGALYNLVVYLAILKAIGSKEKTQFSLCTILASY